MAVYYVDLENGNDSNNGTSFAQRRKTVASVTALGAAGDTYRVMGSPDPVNTGVNATWVDRTRTITLASAVTQTINTCETAWTASANVTATTTTTNKHGTNAANLALAAGFTTGKIAYQATANVNFGAYQQVSFWFKCNVAVTVGVYQIKLCSDSLGVTAVHTINVPSILTGGTWAIVVADIGSAMSATINSVALYRASGSGAATVNLDHIFASKAPASADAITLQSLISKNDGTDIWWPISGIDGTTITLDCYVQNTPVLTPLNVQFFGTSETVALWRRETIKAGYTTGTYQSCASGGLYNNRRYLSGGWNRTDMSTQTGETWIDNLSGMGTGWATGQNTGWVFTKLCAARFGGTGIIVQTGAWNDVDAPGLISCATGIGPGSTGRHDHETYTVGYVNCCSTGINTQFCSGAIIRCGKVWNSVAVGVTTHPTGSDVYGKVLGAVDFRGNATAIQISGYTYQGPLTFYANAADVSGWALPVGVNMTLQNVGNKIGTWNNTTAFQTITVYNDPTTQGLNHIEDFGAYHRQESGVALECLGQNSYTTTVDSAALSFTGDFEVRVKLSPGISFNSSMATTLIAKSASTANQRSWAFFLNGSGNLKLDISTNGSATTSYQSTAVITSPTIALDSAMPNAATMWLRATLDVDNGASGSTCTFYTSIDGTTWTLVQAVTAAVVSIYDSTAPVTVGITNPSSITEWMGYSRIFRAQIYNGIGGTLVYDANFEAQAHGTTSFSDGLGNTIALANSTWGKIGYPGITSTDKPWRSYIYTKSLRTREAPTMLKVGTVAAKTGVPITVSAWVKKCFGDYCVPLYERAYVVDAAPISITGDIDISVDLALDEWINPISGNRHIILTKDDNSGSNREWFLWINSDGTLLFAWWDAATNLRQTATSDAAITFVNGVRNKIRVTLDVDNGSGGHAVTYYTWSGGAWVQLGSVRNSGSFTTNIRDQAATISFPAGLSGSPNFAARGKYYRATIKNGINGTTVLDANFEAQTPETYSFADGYGNTVLLIGGCRIITSGGNTFMDFHPLAADLCVLANQYGGPTTDVIAPCSAANNVYEQLSVSFTPTASAPIDVYFRTFAGSNRSSAYVSSVKATGGLLTTVEESTLNICGKDGPTNTMMTVPLPAVADVETGVVYGTNNELTGTLTLPGVAYVLSGVSYGSSGEFTGTATLPAVSDVRYQISYAGGVGTLRLPAVGDVQSGVSFGAGSEFSGTLSLPATTDVRYGISYGADGEFVGLMVGVPAMDGGDYMNEDPINEVVYARLFSDSVLYSALTDSTSTRIYQERWPIEDDAFPKVVYAVSNRNAVTSYTGKSGVASYSVEIGTLAESAEECSSLAAQVRGLFEDQDWAAPYLPAVQGSFLDDEDISPNQTVLGDDWTVWEMSQTYIVWVEDKSIFKAISAEYVYGSSGGSGPSGQVHITFNLDIDPTSTVYMTCEVQVTEGGAWSGGQVDEATLYGSSGRVVTVSADDNAPIYGVRWRNLSQSFVVDGVLPEEIVVTL